ncbi:MAG: hypothetical protein ACYC0V_04840 [Armatimonadota bacterium]
MFKYIRMIILVLLTLVYAAGITVNAQMADNKIRSQKKQRLVQQSKMNQKKKAIAINQMRRSGARLMSVEGILLPPAKARIMQISRRISLDAKQQARLIALSNKFYATMKPVLVERAKTMQVIRRNMISRKFNGGSLKSSAAKVRRLDAKILDAEINYWTDFNKTLTPQQQAKFNNMTRPMAGKQKQKIR